MLGIIVGIVVTPILLWTGWAFSQDRFPGDGFSHGGEEGDFGTGLDD